QRAQKAIRLIELQSDEANNSICCQIQHHTLAYGPVYDAVSYAWATEDGDDSQSQQITILGSGVMRVTMNCEAALLRSGHASEPHKLWIDSICTNQTNVEELNHQVGLTDLIYRNTIHVHVYIHHPTGTYSDDLTW
ncbi:heterokaryon incompatibility protein-domain-containing protein, partial [Boeremia exigua]|uniref:heterokaryon incompatibility protein-domain-containing protein n=1 Tax=Boeremia exigua TaxID=749465 RepID=UPI001E8D83C6